MRQIPQNVSRDKLALFSTLWGVLDKYPNFPVRMSTSGTNCKWLKTLSTLWKPNGNSEVKLPNGSRVDLEHV